MKVSLDRFAKGFVGLFLASLTVGATSVAPADLCWSTATYFGPPTFITTLYCHQDECEDPCTQGTFTYYEDHVLIVVDRCMCGEKWGSTCCQVVVTSYGVAVGWGRCDGSQECPGTGQCYAEEIDHGDHVDVVAACH